MHAGRARTAPMLPGLQRIDQPPCATHRIGVCSNPVGGFRKGVVEPKNGAKRIRTADLLGAIQALSQLSYSPARAAVYPRPRPAPARSWLGRAEDDAAVLAAADALQR